MAVRGAPETRELLPCSAWGFPLQKGVGAASALEGLSGERTAHGRRGVRVDLWVLGRQLSWAVVSRTCPEVCSSWLWPLLSPGPARGAHSPGVHTPGDTWGFGISRTNTR